MKRLLAAALILLAASASFAAETITQWTFEGDTTAPAVALVGSPSITLAPGITATFAGGYPGAPTGTFGRGYNTIPFAGLTLPITPTNPAPKTRWIEFYAPTTGYMDIKVSYAHRFSNTAPNTAVFQYNTGSGWVDFATYTATAGDTWFPQEFDLSAIAAVNDNPSFAFRVAASVDPVAGEYLPSRSTSTLGNSGTWRFDDVTVTGTVIPEPGSMAALGVGLVSLFGVIRRRSA
jgi:hypothetical protein